jgi:uncharacterized membrane protein
MATTPIPASEPARQGADLDLSIARLLTTGTLISIGLMAVGVVLMAIHGIDPLTATYPAFSLGTIVPDLLALQPVAFLELGLTVVIAMPPSRVVASLIGYRRRGEQVMVLVSVVILIVISLSVILGATGA